MQTGQADIHYTIFQSFLFFSIDGELRDLKLTGYVLSSVITISKMEPLIRADHLSIIMEVTKPA